ncbi:hypothetical protein [Pararhizobium polonicum]|uniref:hypothetical protein n=1 Tax=Pararhizobium polonicum TaxID=1612624 RepID=UPI001313F6D2|nr:hypothetical protein [Pararhizobium polonicum]
MKARRIPLGLVYIATLVLLVVLIPLLRLAGPHAATLMHRQSTSMALRLDKAQL